MFKIGTIWLLEMSFLLVTPLTGRSVSPGDPADQLLRPASRRPGVRGREDASALELFGLLQGSVFMQKSSSVRRLACAAFVLPLPVIRCHMMAASSRDHSTVLTPTPTRERHVAAQQQTVSVL